jgi:hypothetical protein
MAAGKVLFRWNRARNRARSSSTWGGPITNEEINDLAEHAAISALDAHGVENVPDASVALDFIQNMHYELEEEVPVLTRREYLAVRTALQSPGCKRPL